MRRKLCAVLCAVLLLISLAAPSASAAAGVYFTAANETIRELTEATMPFWANGDLYVDGSLFENKDLYTGFFYNASKNMAVVYSRKTANYALYFDLGKNRVDNAEGYGYYPPAILRNGVVFVPVSLVTSYFELGYANLRVAHGYLLRVRSDKAVLSDRTLADAGSARMDSQYQQYLAAKNTAQPPEPSGSGGETVKPPEPARGQTVRLCFRAAAAAEDTAALLDLLDGGGARATFYFSAEQLEQQRDLVRRLAATGHAIGLAADGSRETDIAGQLRLANETLWRTAGTKTRLCVLENGGDAARQAAEEAGYRCLAPDLDCAESGLRTSSAANALLKQINGRKDGQTVWLAAGAEEAGLRTFLRLSQQADHRLVGLTETD